MAPDFDDAVIFELPTFEDVEAFCDRFGSRWPSWTHTDATVWLFAVDLTSAADDLPVLLRETQDLVAELGLPTIGFYLDGRPYVLDAATPPASPGGARQAVA